MGIIWDLLRRANANENGDGDLDAVDDPANSTSSYRFHGNPANTDARYYSSRDVSLGFEDTMMFRHNAI